jgi:competence protein ComEC
LTGDAEDVSENEMLNNGYDLKADVLKVGHHGSISSTTAKFALKVKPKYSVISVGKYDSYGHPDSIVINRLQSLGSEVYRTNINETIVAVLNGTDITFTFPAFRKHILEFTINKH